MLAKQDLRVAQDSLYAHEPDVVEVAVDDFLRGMQIHAIHLNVVSLYKPDCNLIVIPMDSVKKDTKKQKNIRIKNRVQLIDEEIFAQETLNLLSKNGH